ncbi:MAG TPA: PAS domain S-box protein [Anaerovoracaceae bacterium]|nr:PAS domain S-box protein [Anaerovoracaceae bacterium]
MINKLNIAILENHPEIIVFAFDCNYRYLAFNRNHKEAMKRIWGSEIEIGMNMLDAIGNPEDREKAKINFDRSIGGESFTLMEEHGEGTTGRHYWQSFWSPIFSDNEKIIGSSCFVQDITERRKAEVALEKEMKFTEALLESIPGFLYVYDEAERLIKWNKKHEQMTGYTADELSQMTLDKWYEGEDSLRIANAAKQVFETGYGEVEANLMTKGGGKLLVRVNGVRLEIGGKTYFTGVGLDISKQKENEDAIRRSEAMLKATVSNISDVITIVDENGSIKYVSPNITKFFGWNPEDLIGRSYLETVHPDDRDRMLKVFEFLLHEDGAKVVVECRYKNKNGNDSFIELKAVNLLNNPDINGILANFNDITERKKTENDLRESEEKYRLITENISDVIWVLNVTKNKFTYISPSIFQLRGITPEEAINERMEEAFIPESLEIAREAIIKNTNDFINNPNVPKTLRQEFRQPCKDGTTVWVEVTGRYRYNSDGEIELVGASHDIQERKMAEEQILDILNHDQLTGIYNRRFYEEELKIIDTELHLPIALVMVDVNGLKLINDAFGHQTGDMLLQKIANILSKECNTDGIVSRIGGDEFILLLPRTDAEKVNKLIERIGESIANEKMDNVIISVAIGFAVKHDIADDMKEVFKEAEDDLYRHKIAESSSMRSKTIELIMNSLFEKNKREMLHSQRVGELCEAIAGNMNLAKHDVNQMRIAGLMHDIGKIGIQDTILNKMGKLDQDEWDQIKRHSEIGYRILSSVSEFSEIANYVLEHQERWDGKGYPNGLKGDEISIQARIIAVADSYDAMTSDRAYRRGLSEEEAIGEIKKHSGTQFDPDIVKIFLDKVLKSNNNDSQVY